MSDLEEEKVSKVAEVKEVKEEKKEVKNTKKSKSVEDNKEDKERKRVLRNLGRLFVKIIILLVIAYIVFGVIFGVKRMTTNYMDPYISEGELLIFYRMDKNFNIGDVVYFKNNSKNYVQRIVATEGQTVDIDFDGVLLINGRPEEHKNYVDTKKIEDEGIEFPYLVGPGQYFVMNDNREQMEDSRYFGSVRYDSIIGKVMGTIKVRNI